MGACSTAHRRPPWLRSLTTRLASPRLRLGAARRDREGSRRRRRPTRVPTAVDARTTARPALPRPDPATSSDRRPPLPAVRARHALGLPRATGRENERIDVDGPGPDPARSRASRHRRARLVPRSAARCSRTPSTGTPRTSPATSGTSARTRGVRQDGKRRHRGSWEAGMTAPGRHPHAARPGDRPTPTGRSTTRAMPRTWPGGRPSATRW